MQRRSLSFSLSHSTRRVGYEKRKMIDRRPPPARPLAVSPAALRDATGQANSFEMTPIRRKEAVVDGEAAAEAEEEGSVLEVATVSTAPPSSSATAAPAAAAPIEQRRLEAQRHRYAEVWTKDPHGGRHRPVSGAGERGKEGKGFSCPFCTSFSRRKKNEGKKNLVPRPGLRSRASTPSPATPRQAPSCPLLPWALKNRRGPVPQPTSSGTPCWERRCSSLGPSSRRPTPEL